MSTMKEIFDEWMTKKGAVLCSCGREKVYYYCPLENCDKHQVETYCKKCRDEGKIEHTKHSPILPMLRKLDGEWKTLYSQYE